MDLRVNLHKTRGLFWLPEKLISLYEGQGSGLRTGQPDPSPRNSVHMKHDRPDLSLTVITATKYRRDTKMAFYSQTTRSAVFKQAKKMDTVNDLFPSTARSNTRGLT